MERSGDVSMSIEAGRYRHYLHYIPLVQGVDSAGAPTESYPENDTGMWFWGRVEYLTGRELWSAQQANSEVEGKITTRLFPLDPTAIIKHKDIYLEIMSYYENPTANMVEILFKKRLD